MTLANQQSDLKLEGDSIDITQQLKDQLYELMPQVFTEGKQGKIDWEKLKATLGEDITFSNERYVLNWAGKSDAFKLLQEPTTKTLVPAKSESINFENTENIFIEGENLEVLKVLQKSYFGKIKMIYIDPPYNTGNDSFIYPDKFSESKEEYLKRVGDKDESGIRTREGRFGKNSKENGQYHSNWLNMMYPRLFLARNLLKDDGVIFVSIDDNEVHNLRLIMNEIFGEENYLANVTWRHTKQSKNDEPYFSRVYNALLIYQKSDALPHFSFPRNESDNKNYFNPDNDPNGAWRSGDVRSPSYRKTLCYEIKTPKGNIIPSPNNGWRWTKQEVDKKIISGEIIFNSDETKIIRKIYLKEQEGRTPENIWDTDLSGTTRQANSEIKLIFNDQALFDTPKPTALIKRCMQLFYGEKDFIALDFFSGSGTLAHSILDLNQQDNGNRKFICVQLSEPCDVQSESYKAGYPTISDIAKERIRRVIKKIKGEQSGQLEFSSNQMDLGVKVFKLTESNFKQWQPNPQTETELAEQLKMFINPIKGNPSQEEMLIELVLKSGLSLNSSIKKQDGFYNINNGELIVVLERASENTFLAIAQLNPQKVIVLDTVFQNNDQLKTNVALQMKDAGIEFKTV